MTEQALIKVDNLVLGYNKPGDTPQAVLGPCHLELSSGQILAILGPNGCGKSTLIKALARRLKPQKGTVKLADVDIWSLSNAEYARKVAYVPQSLIIPAEMTVKELVGLGRNPHQKWWQSGLGSADKEIVKNTLVLLDLEALQNKLVTRLSGGERQRAILGMALCQKPALLLLDEPTAGMDFRHQLELLEILKTLKGQGIAVVTVLHDLSLASSTADSIALVKANKNESATIKAIGQASVVLTPALLQDVFDVQISIHQGDDGNNLYQMRRL